MRELSIRIALGAEAKQILSPLGDMLILLASWLCRRHFPRRGHKPHTLLSNRLPSPAQDPLVLLSVASYVAHGVTFRGQPSKTRTSYRSGNPAARAVANTLSNFR